MPTLTDLPALLVALPAGQRTIADRILHVALATGQLNPPPEMEPWIIRYFGDVGVVRAQAVVTVLNRLTLEGALFNPLRARRPAGAIGGDAELERWVAEELAEDGFAAPLRDTPADAFGRMIGRHCISASNIAKYDAWHGLVIPSEPHPLRFEREHLRDYLDVALRWIAAAHRHDPGAIYPLITWNCLPKSGATIVHGHWQMVVARSMPAARTELWRRAALAYRTDSGRDYYADLAGLHDALGLNLEWAGLAAFVHLTPLRNREVILMADLSQGDHQPLADAICAVLRALIDRMGTRAFNLAIALPPLADTNADWRGFPALVRIGDRGPALTTRADVGAMELYGTGVIAEDPFEVAARLRSALMR